MPGGAYIAIGMEKSAKIIEGSGSNLSLVISPKVSLFHYIERMDEKIGDMLRNRSSDEEINRLIRGIFVFPFHLYEQNGRVKIARVIGIGPPANETPFEYNGKYINVADYFRDVRNWNLNNPSGRTVICKQDKSTVFYPLEVCDVCDNNRVSTSAITNEYLTKLIRVSFNN